MTTHNHFVLPGPGRATAAATMPRPRVFLPGWGFDGRILQLMQPRPPWIIPTCPLLPATLAADLLDFLEQRHITRIDLVGWSMGGRLALDFARRHPGRVASLSMVAVRRHWPAAEIEAVRRTLLDHRRRSLLAFYRKCFLGDKKNYQAFVDTLQASYLDTMDNRVLEQGLRYLAVGSVAPEPLPPGVTVRCIHGRRDIIAPVKRMATLPGAIVELLNNGGHTAWLSPRCSLWSGMRKASIRHRFSRAATTYDVHAQVQHQVAVELDQRLARFIAAKPVKSILEIGCGTGNFTRLLAQRFVGADILALDFAPAMVAEARRKIDRPGITFLCEDAEIFLDLARSRNRRYDLITSNGTLQWFSDHERSIINMKKLLRPDGVICCSLFGPETMKELGQGLTEVLGWHKQLTAAAFADKEELRQAIQPHCPNAVLDEWRITKHYLSPLALLRHIGKTGTVGWRQNGPALLTRSRLARLDQWFQQQHKGCNVTYQVFILQWICNGDECRVKDEHNRSSAIDEICAGRTTNP